MFEPGSDNDPKIVDIRRAYIQRMKSQMDEQMLYPACWIEAREHNRKMALQRGIITLVVFIAFCAAVVWAVWP